MKIYEGTIRYVNDQGEYSVINNQDNTSNEHCFIITDGTEKKKYSIGTVVLVIEHNHIHYIIGKVEDTNQYKLNGFSVDDGKIMMAGDDLCLYLDRSGRIGLYQISKNTDDTPALKTVWEYDFEKDVLNQYFATLNTFIQGANCKAPNFSITRNDSNDIVYQMSGKLNVADLSNRFLIQITNPITSGKGTLYMKIDRTPVPLRTVPLKDPIPLESIELKLGPQTDGTILEIDCTPIWKIKLDALGKASFKNKVANLTIDATGTITAKSGLSNVSISPTGVINISGISIKISGTNLTLNQVPMSPGFCKQIICPMTGAPLTTNTVPLKR